LIVCDDGWGFFHPQGLGEVRNPYFVGIKINDGGTHQIFYSKLGGVEKADQFLEMMLRLYGLREVGAEQQIAVSSLLHRAKTT